MLRLIYTAIFYLALPLYFIRLIIRAVQNPDYLKRWGERLGYGSNLPTEGKTVLWIHAVSVGEVNASIPLVRSLLDTYSNSEILVTTSTPTGSKILLDKMGARVKHQYVPLDLPACLNVFLDRWNPKAVIVLETEIWPNILAVCKERGIFTALVNARLSEKSKDKYNMVRPLAAETLGNLDLLIAQYDSDANRFKEINTNLKIEVCGNLKFDQQVPEEMHSISSSIRDSWSEGEQRPTLIAASTHETEEEFVLDAFLEILEEAKDALLIIVPRHPERFETVFEYIQNRELSVARRSNKDDVTPETKVLLGDTMGELNFLYSVSDVAFVGGSLVDHGGQNLLEPASLGLPLSSGKSLRNFQEIADELQEDKALFLIEQQKELSDFFIEMISKPRKSARIGKASAKVFEKNRGVLIKINKFLNKPLSKLLS
ncbi:MAG: lipid IV(A) 3-deoxy-D-manno-octulosonic acid transferase [SAR86 cluster bacterium]|nr:lipid IV(A) 3-deoxy-D-manno-octulosonic acid transferase [SAR86 cluster bacterium]